MHLDSLCKNTFDYINQLQTDLVDHLLSVFFVQRIVVLHVLADPFEKSGVLISPVTLVMDHLCEKPHHVNHRHRNVFPKLKSLLSYFAGQAR